MKIIAKFRCDSLAETTWGNIAVCFTAVYGNEGENADFSKTTPSGQILINVDRDTKAATEFVRGEEYYLTFEKAEKK